MSYESKVAEALGGVVDIQKHIVGMARPAEGLGERIVKSEVMRDFVAGRSQQVRIPLTPLEFKTAIIGAGTQNDPLGNVLRPSIAEGARRRLFLRDLLRGGTTSEAAVEYPIEASLSNTAAIQDRENTALTETGATFSLSFEPVQTLGHYATCSKQILQDSSALDVYLRDTLLYGLRLVEENQILNGDGTNSQLNGLLAGATAYTVQSPQLTNELDIIRESIKQLQVADYTPQAIVLNPSDWYDIDVRKAGSSDDEYVGGDPRDMSNAQLWGLPVIPTNAIASGTFLVGDFARGAVLFDRQEAAIEVSRYHDQNLEKGMITLLATERVALVVANSTGLVTGSL